MRTLYLRRGDVNEPVGDRCDRCGQVIWKPGFEPWQPGSPRAVVEEEFPF
jgi:hypothetical protein